MKPGIAVIAACVSTVAMAPDAGRHGSSVLVTNAAPLWSVQSQDVDSMSLAFGIDLSAAATRRSHDGEIRVAIYGHNVDDVVIGNLATPGSSAKAAKPGTTGVAAPSSITNRGSVVAPAAPAGSPPPHAGTAKPGASRAP